MPRSPRCRTTPCANFSPANFQQYNVIRVGDEILVDLMRSAGGIDYAEAAKDVVVREVGGVPIPLLRRGCSGA